MGNACAETSLSGPIQQPFANGNAQMNVPLSMDENLLAQLSPVFFWVLLAKGALYGKRAGAVAGCDFLGIVEEIGSNVPQGLRSIGERVAGLVLGG